MVGAKENMTIEEDADMDSKQWAISDSQVRYYSIQNSSAQFRYRPWVCERHIIIQILNNHLLIRTDACPLELI